MLYNYVTYMIMWHSSDKNSMIVEIYYIRQIFIQRLLYIIPMMCQLHFTSILFF